MFTGIIESVGKIKSIDKSRFVISHDFSEKFELGESIACNGACMTVVEFAADSFSVDIIKESRNVTSFSDSLVGDFVNLERSVVIGQRNSGHNVTGHVDQVGDVLSVKKVDDYWLFRISVLPQNRKYLVYKGSICLEGISLTVSQVSDLSDKTEAWFEVSIIPHTYEFTSLKNKKIGDVMNLEFDILGKYILNNV